MERELYKSKDGVVTVTTGRLAVGTATYPMSGITSVQTQVIPAPRAGIIAFGVLVILATLWLWSYMGTDAIAYILGGMLLGVFSVLIGATQKDDHVVMIGTSGGQVTAYKSQDGEAIRAITAAITETIVSR